uniref:Ribonuclease kappa n=1 Tax=Rhabditophanes sp. KR3021 TaxID=114890 RepID=A0AC35U7V1_9BILA
MVKLCPLCGPKMSAFLMLISVWGIFFLGLLGVFFYTQAVTLYPDLHFSEESVGPDGPTTDAIIAKYGDKATQCWVAAGMYVITFVVVVWQNKYNPVSVL